MPTAIENDLVTASIVVNPSAGDGVGGAMTALDVPSVRILAPVKGQYTRCTALHYMNAGTAHTITFMTPLGDDSATLTADTALNGTTFSVSIIPRDSTGNAPASADWMVVRGTDNNLYSFHIASYSSKVITITATSTWGDANGTGVPIEFPSGNVVWFFGSPTADQYRRIVAPASLPTNINGVLCTTPKVYQPILVHSNNGTAAALSFLVSGDNPKPV